MQKIDFAQTLDQLVNEDPRYHRDAYLFLRDSLDYTIKLRKKNKIETGAQHVRGPELLEGFRLFSLKEFGPMVPTVFGYWGLERCEDVGAMVFNLIRVGVFGKNEQDSLEDFKGGYDFHEAFVVPFLPTPVEKVAQTTAAASEPAAPEPVERGK